MTTCSLLQSLQTEFITVQKSLKDVDENIKRITGRDPDEFRLPPGGGARRFQGPPPDSSFRNRPPPQWRNGIGDGPFSRRRANSGAQGNASFPKRLRVEQEESPDEEELPNKPAIHSSVVPLGKLSRTRKDMIEQQKKDKGFERNKRMFGLLLGTLQKFQHEQSSRKEQLSKREEIEKKLEEQAEKEREEVKREKQELFLARREKQAQIKCLEQKMEIAKMHDVWESNRRKMLNFIKTQASPPLFYLPARHTSKTERKLKESKQRIEEEIKQRRAEVEAQLKEIDQRMTSKEDPMEGEYLSRQMQDYTLEQPMDETSTQEDNVPMVSSSNGCLGEGEEVRTENDAAQEELEDSPQSPEPSAEKTVSNITAEPAEQEFEPIYDDE